MWMSIGAYTVVGTPSGLEYPVDNCSVLNTTDSITTTLAMNVTNTMPVEISGLSAMYTISYLWYPAIGAATVIVVGLIISVLTGMDHIGDVDTMYLSPFFDRIFCCLPGPISRALRCNQEFVDPEKIKINDYEEDIYINAPANLTNGKPYIDLDHTPVYGLSFKDSNSSLNGIQSPWNSVTME